MTWRYASIATGSGRPSRRSRSPPRQSRPCRARDSRRPALRSSSGTAARAGSRAASTRRVRLHVPGASLTVRAGGHSMDTGPQRPVPWATSALRGAWLRRARCARAPARRAARRRRAGRSRSTTRAAPPAREPSAQSLTGSGELTGAGQQRRLGRRLALPCSLAPDSSRRGSHRALRASRPSPLPTRSRSAGGLRRTPRIERGTQRRLVELDRRPDRGLGSRGQARPASAPTAALPPRRGRGRRDRRPCARCGSRGRPRARARRRRRPP